MIDRSWMSGIRWRVMRRLRRIICGAGVLMLVLVGSYLLLLRNPRALFAYSVASGPLSLYSDRPFAVEAGRSLLDRVHAKLARSPLYSPQEGHAVFICNAPWRQRLFVLAAPGAGGVNYYPLTTNVFMLSAVFDEDRLVSRSGKPDLFGRKLDHFIAHEIAHTLTARATGVLRFHARLSNWVKEGYAEYVGWGDDAPPYEESARALSAEAPQMNVPPAVPYLRIRLLVAYLIEKKGWPVARLLDDAVSQREVEAMLKADAAELR